VGGGGGDVGVFAAGAHGLVDGVESLLGAVCDLQDVVRPAWRLRRVAPMRGGRL
jgi:hypothetical protein